LSTVYRIKTNKKIVLKDIFDYLSNEFPNLSAEEREKDYVFFYLNGMSTRGVDVSLENYGLEIRNTVMSNKADIMLTFRIIMYLITVTESLAFDEDDNKILPGYFIDKKIIENNFKNDLRTIFLIIENMKKTIEFPGPTRSVFIGNNIFYANSDYKENIDFIAEGIEDLFLKVLYRLPGYREGALLGADSNEEDKMIKLKILTSDDDYIIQDYDYIIIGNDEEMKKDGVIMLNIEKIRIILPETWEIIDECTIVAPRLTFSDWRIFKEKCKSNNCYEEFSRKTKK
jgi:hypothetical protein